MKYLITERQYKVLISEDGNSSDPSTYPKCVARYVGGGILSQKVGEITTTKSGQQSIIIYDFPGYNFYNNGRVRKPDKTMTSYSCGTNDIDIIIDGVNLTQEKWKKEKGKYTTDYEKKELRKSEKTLENLEKLDLHTLSTVSGIAFLFIPVVGPIISAGIGLADAALTYSEGDEKTATMMAMFPFLPVGKIVKVVPAVGKLGKEGMEELAKKMGKEGQVFTQLEKEAVEGMAKNKAILQQDLKNISDDLVKKSKASGGKVLSSMQKKFSLGECFSASNCPAARAIISDFYQKLAPTAKLTKFYPKDVKVLTREVIYPNTNYAREALEVQVKDGPKFLIYRSSGANEATTGKKAGEWFVIPGWAQNGWFFKTDDTIALTKGGNKYLTDLAQFLEYNGSSMLGK